MKTENPIEIVEADPRGPGEFRKIRWQQVGLKGASVRRWTVSKVSEVCRVILRRTRREEGILRPTIEGL